jgi:hypothetical protein
MLKRIKNQKIGTFRSTTILLNQFIRLNRKRIKKNDLEIFCKEKDRSFGETFNWKIVFLTTLGIISKKDNSISLNISKNIINDTQQLKNHINNSFLSYIKNHKIFFTIFPQSSFSYNTQSKTVYIKSSHLPLEYNSIKSYIVSSGLLKSHFESKGYELEKSYYKNFEDLLLSFKVSNRSRIKQSLDQLKNRLLKQEERGYAAEQFVLEYEKKRLAGHPKIESVRIISQLDVNAGYDIVSYDSLDSTEVDRFIEVKSFLKSFGFYWTSNEISVAKEKESSYNIYIVDSEKIDSEDYVPEIYNNPYTSIFHSEQWKKDEKVFYLKRS